ncbi:MAG TPA: hypothetical protein VHA56_10055 [Mucilaginibacter sp.]|nr:hypothetical protein [Mucilaginibacter sp.]
MKISENFKGRLLTRTELSKVKGGIDCNVVYAQCDASCGHFSTDYPRFATCVTAQTMMCSPLHGWDVECPNG